MFFDDINQITKIASRSGTSIFVIPENIPVKIKDAIIIEPVGKTTISIEQVRELFGRLGLKQVSEHFVIIRPADKLSIEAGNALLKNLEEPQEKVHFLLITDTPSKLLPTIISRSALYFLRAKEPFRLDIEAEENVKQLAKELLVARSQDLVSIADTITKKKDNLRERALKILATAIEMSYKSYFLTGKEVFIGKIPKFLTAYENIASNGHIKLHLIADLC